MMLTIDLPAFADRLRGMGFDVDIQDRVKNILQTVLRVGEYEYPLWELNLAENQEALAGLDFDAIRSRRAPGWTIERPVKLGPQ